MSLCTVIRTRRDLAQCFQKLYVTTQYVILILPVKLKACST